MVGDPEPPVLSENDVSGGSLNRDEFFSGKYDVFALS